MQIFPVDFMNRKGYRNIICDFFYATILYQQIALKNASFINDRNTLNQVILHILNLNRNHLMMQFIKTVARHIIILILPCFGYCQSTYLPQGSQYEHFLDRIGIKMQTNPDLNIFTAKPLSRKLFVNITEQADSLSAIFPEGDALHLEKTYQDNPQSLLMNNSEWVSGN